MDASRSTNVAPSDQFDVLDWDSARFGFPVARVRPGESATALERIGDRMRECGIVLAYLGVPVGLPEIPSSVLSNLGGRLVDHRITYTADLTPPSMPERLPGLASIDSSYRITEYQSTATEPSLIRLARESGAFSRFRVDPQIPPGVFEAIYDAWIRRSVNHEIADEVLVARDSRRVVGFVSVKTNEMCGEIGLLAVDESVRGRGLGGGLVRAAHSSMGHRGCTQARVATQRANRAGCALYESEGYTVDRIERVYHLWLSARQP